MKKYRPNKNRKSFAIKAGWLIDGTGHEALQDVLMYVNEEGIMTLESEGHYDPNREALIDYTGCTVIPCLIDSHVHLCMSGILNKNVREKQLKFDYNDAEEAISGHLYDHLKHGVTAVRDAGDYGGHVLRYRDKSLNSKKVPVFIRSAGRGWMAYGRYGKLVGRPPFPGERLYDAILRENEPVDHIKIINSGLVSLKEFGKEGTPQFDFNQLEDAVKLSVSLGLKTMVHANGREPVKQAIDAGCNSIEHGFFMGTENIYKMASAGTTWVPTAYTMKAYAENLSFPRKERDVALKNYEHQLKQIALAAQCGVTIAAGTDSGSSGVNHGAAIRYELRALMDAGLSVETAIKCATLNGSALLGFDDIMGRLTAGSYATFVVLKGDKSRLPGSLDSPMAIYINGTQVFPLPHCQARLTDKL